MKEDVKHETHSSQGGLFFGFCLLAVLERKSRDYFTERTIVCGNDENVRASKCIHNVPFGLAFADVYIMDNAIGERKSGRYRGDTSGS